MQTVISSSTMFLLCVCVVLVSVCQCFPLHGWIQSPGFPHGYSSDLNETWTRCAPPGHHLRLSLVHLDLEDSVGCENDGLKIYEDREVLAELCGKTSIDKLQSAVNPLLRSSSGGCLSVHFHSDYSNPSTHAGFKAFYTTHDVDECWDNEVECSHFCHNYIGGYSCSCKPGYYLDDDQHGCRADCNEEHHGAGVLTAPGSPGPYFENADCVFNLSVDEGKQLELKFTGVFDVESRNGKCIDYVQIKTDTGNFGTFCGKNRPADIETGAQRVQVIFHSNQEGINLGFSLKYRPKVMECSAQVTPNSLLAPVRDRYVTGDTVTVSCLTGYITSDSTTYKSKCQSDGTWKPKYTCEAVDCGKPEISDLMLLTEENTKTTYNHKISIKCSSQYYKLVGNAEFSCNASGHWTNENVPECVPVCGINKLSAGRIFGGTKAKLGQIPWQLLVTNPRGGATLISDRWAITAAHVVESHKVLQFRGGMINAQDEDRIELEVNKIIIHPSYDKTTFDNDIALLKMSSRVPLNDTIMPLCLPEKKTNGPVLEGMTGTVSGFGAQSDTRMRSQYLQYGNVNEFPGVCFETTRTVTENMFCAGDSAGKVDSCFGDSGGPLFVPMLGTGSASSPYRLKGIVSWGSLGCGNITKGYYTKVENYLDWIRETIKAN